MKQYGVVLTDNFNGGKTIDFLRFYTEKEAEEIYQEYKRKGFGVVKVNIEKAYELNVMYV
ncbi:hypothetical protein NST81_09350 [Bacillus sp. FSL W8-0223]|uniref:hypothetical protein n=1 Tax=Bacillus sp. FSL W8-0223 TaxID=2954595 RepID=UPI0030FA43F9